MITVAEITPTESQLTYGMLFNLYIDKFARHHTKTADETVANFQRYFRRWINQPVATIRRRDVQDWFDDLAITKGKHSANRNHDTMRAVFNWGIRKEYILPPNPCIGIDRYKLKARDRFVQPGDEFERLADAIDSEPDETARDFFWTCIYTGARRSNVLSMRWEFIDFQLGLWRIPETKNGDSQFVILTEQAIQLLVRRKEKVSSPWVFPSSKIPGRHFGHPRYAWKRILKRAGIEDLRIHDLRRTLGSYMAISGTSPTIIGKALGHKSLQATAVYARLTHAPVREAMERALASIPRPRLDITIS